MQVDWANWVDEADLEGDDDDVDEDNVKVLDDSNFDSWVQAQKAYYGVRHGAAPPLDPSLSRRLAENEGGGPDRT